MWTHLVSGDLCRYLARVVVGGATVLWAELAPTVVVAVNKGKERSKKLPVLLGTNE